MKSATGSLLLILFFLFFPGSAKEGFSWGIGHRTIGEGVLLRLPESLKKELTPDQIQAFLTYNSYPDSLENVDPNLAGPNAILRMKEFKTQKRFFFHKPEGRCIAFEMLVQSLREKDWNRFVLWLGILSHSTADQISCNHEPLLHFITYCWGEEGMKLTNDFSKCLDLGWIEGDPKTQKIWTDAVRDLSIPNTICNQKEIFFALHTIEWEGLEGNRYSMDLIRAINAWNSSKGYQEQADLARTLVPFGTWAVRRIMIYVHSAIAIAQSTKNGKPLPVRFEPDQVKDLQKWIDRFILDRPITDDAFIVPFLPPAGSDPKIGILYDPSGRMGEGFFSFIDRVAAGLIAGSLQHRGSAGILDVRKVIRSGIDPKKTPLLILPCSRLTNYYPLKKKNLIDQIVQYRNKGGKILWIGGSPPQEILSKDLFGQMIFNPEKSTYLNPVYTVPMKDLMKSSVLLNGKEEGKFIREPRGKAGWSWPRSPWYFKEGARKAADVFLELKSPDKTRIIGILSPKDHPDFGWLPAYTVFPCIFSGDHPRISPFELKLDSTEEKILEYAVDSLLLL
ncbi:MAG: hypothetical protein Q4G69_01865 [Planctomycetia bacterium]|nr:hypothetical protein [Planctomycetia bacterium]